MNISVGRIMASVRWLASAVGGLLSAGSALAASEPVVPGFNLAPGTRLEAAATGRGIFTDNMYYTPSERTYGSGLLLNPAATLSYIPTGADYRLIYLGEYATFDTSDKDGYDDHRVLLSGKLHPALQHRFDVDLDYQHGHDAFGTNRTQGVTAAIRERDLDIWDQWGVSGKYTFGAPAAPLNVYARGGHSNKHYDTNREDGALQGTRFLDYQAELLGAGATYRLSGKTQFLLDSEWQDFHYRVDAAPTFNSSLLRLRGGMRWAATAQTTGEIQVGYYERNFRAASRADVSGLDWQAKVVWDPRVRSQFTFTTGRLIRENYLLGDNFINEQYAGVNWRQNWSSLLFTDTNINYYNDKYEGTGRTDDGLSAGVNLYYRLSKQSRLRAGYERAHRESGQSSTFNFERNTVYAGFEFTL